MGIIMKFLFVSLFAASFLNLSNVHAATSIPSLNNITDENFQALIKEFSANQNFYTVSPASSLGKVFGFELGMVAGVTNTPDFDKIVKTVSPTAKNVDMLPHASLLGRFSVPYGITAEIQYFPKKTISGVSYKQSGGSLGWTVTDVFFTELPVTLATKAFYTSSKLSFGTTINNSTTANQNVDVTAAIDDKIYGVQLLASREFFGFVEPYLGLGYAKAKGTFGIDGSGTATYSFFSTTFTAATSATSKPKSAQLIGGLNLQALFFVLGAEYVKVFGTSLYNGKVSFRF
jgi:hypothetical protein